MADNLAGGLLLQAQEAIPTREEEIIGRSGANMRRIVRRSSSRARRFWEWQESQQREFVILLMTLLGVQHRPERVMWARERSSHWWRDIVLDTFGDQQWLKNFCMRRATFDHIVAKLRNHIERADTNMRRCVTVEVHVAVTLWLLATGSSYRSVGHLFGLAKCTCCVIFHDTCAAIVRVLLPQYIKMPSPARLTEITEGFATRFGFPNCAGVIDGMHIPILVPQQHHTDYHNRKGYYSIVAQVMCDHQSQVMNIAAGWPGRVHDARVLANSSIFAKAEAGVLFPDTPLQRARMTIENTFGRCKARWRMLLKRMDIRTEDVMTVILVCFTLNNICEVHKEPFNVDWADDANKGANQQPQNVAHDVEGEDNGAEIREAFVSYFCS